MNDRTFFLVHASILLDDLRVLGLDPAPFKLFFLVYALCARVGEKGLLRCAVSDLTLRLPYTKGELARLVPHLEAAGLVRVVPEGVVIPDWEDHQPDVTEAERKRRWRSKHGGLSVPASGTSPSHTQHNATQHNATRNLHAASGARSDRNGGDW